MSTAARKRMEIALHALQTEDPALFETCVRRMLNLGGRPAVSDERKAFILASWRRAYTATRVGKKRWCEEQTRTATEAERDQMTAEAVYRLEAHTPVTAEGLLQALKRADRRQRVDADFRGLVEFWESFLVAPRLSVRLKDET